MHYILLRYNNVARSASHPISYFESSHFLVRHQADKKFRGLWQQDCFASFWFLEAMILLVSANISLALTKTLSASGNENVAKTARFLSFAESKPWATKLIVVTTRVGPTNVSSLAFVFALTPGAGFGTTTTDRRWSSPSCISTIPKPRALTVCRKLFTELMMTKILCIKWSSPVVCSHKQNL